jgi:hypothetical protein
MPIDSAKRGVPSQVDTVGFSAGPALRAHEIDISCVCATFNSKPTKSSYMNKPQEISIAEWDEIMQMEAIREDWGLDGSESPEQFADMVYGVKFSFATGGPGYRGDLYILHGDALGEPVTLIREDGVLILA